MTFVRHAGLVLLFGFSCVAGSCSSRSTCDVSTLGCPCEVNDLCQVGLVCVDQRCVDLRGDAGDDSGVADAGSRGDAGPRQPDVVGDGDGDRDGDGDADVDSGSDAGGQDGGAADAGSDVAGVDDGGVDDSGAAAECGDGVMQNGEVCDDGVNDGSYGGCEPGCASAGPYCGDGVVQTSDGELCDGDCSTTCEPLDACDTAESSGSIQACSLQCTHTAATTCDDGDGCCPGGCNAGNDNDCDATTVNVTLCVRNDNSVVVVPPEITAPFNSNLRIHWTNVCAREVWVVNFRFGTTWSQLAVLGPGESTSPDVGVAEGPWCYMGGVEYRLGGLAYPADDKGYLLLHCTD